MRRIWATLLCALALGCVTTTAALRFPPPEFEDHTLPATVHPPARSLVWQYADAGVLVAGLGLATYLVLKQRSRKAVLGLSVFSLAYFGFYREGCICAIGSVQNVALALADRSYGVPMVVLIFFVAPLLFALLAGRTFCAAVCPHGALQELVLLKPVRLPPWLERGLSVLPFVYLGAGVLFAATGSGFIICKYDPFVPLFRLSGSATMLGLGAAFLVLGVFVGRPYCRFLCPYGALLKLAAMVAKWRVRVTPDYCTQCRLCEHSCPYGALREPEAASADPRVLAADRRRLGVLLLLLPVLIAAGVWLGSELSVATSRLHPTVRAAERYARQQATPHPFGPQTAEALSLKRAEANAPQLLESALSIRRNHARGGRILGGWIGLVLGIGVIGLSVRRARMDYEPDRGACFGCARCFEYCPNERVRLGLLPEPAASSGAAPVQPAAVPKG